MYLVNLNCLVLSVNCVLGGDVSSREHQSDEGHSGSAKDATTIQKDR